MSSEFDLEDFDPANIAAGNSTWDDFDEDDVESGVFKDNASAPWAVLQARLGQEGVAAIQSIYYNPVLLALKKLCDRYDSFPIVRA